MSFYSTQKEVRKDETDEKNVYPARNSGDYRHDMLDIGHEKSGTEPEHCTGKGLHLWEQCAFASKQSNTHGLESESQTE